MNLRPLGYEPHGRLVLVALLVLVTLLVALVTALTNVLFCGVYSPVDLFVVLMVGLALGEFPCFIDRLVGLLWMLLDVGLRLLFKVLELAHGILLCLTGSGLPPDRAADVRYPHTR